MFDPVADFNAKVDAVIAKGAERNCRVAIKNVERMIASLRFAPRGLHVTHLIEGKARLERSLSALEGAASAKAAA